MHMHLSRSVHRFTSQILVSCSFLKSPNILFSTMSAEKKTALLLVADGSEEMEAVITIDILRRAGINVTVASITENERVKCSRDVNICADTKLSSVIKNKYDAVILPGGLGGMKAFSSSSEVGELLKMQEAEQRVIAAICASPVALKVHNIAKGKEITSYPSMKDELTADYKYNDEKIVVTDGNLITSKGPATSFAFGLAIVEKLLNKETALPVAKGVLYRDYE